MPTRTCAIGIHGRNRPTFEEADYQLIREMRAETIKMMSQTQPVVFDRIARENPEIEFITRLDHPDLNTGGHPPADRYANDLTPVIRDLLPFCSKFQITNEPNHLHRYEGWGKEDADAQDYNSWFIQVYQRLKNTFPQATFGFPGLAVPDFLHRDKAWLNICREAIEQADWLGVHAYWQTPPQQESMKFNESFGLAFKYYHQLFPTKILEILECGNSNSQTQGFHISDDAIAQEYVDWLEEVFRYPYINSTAFFIISSPDPQWAGFTWRREDGGFKPVVQHIKNMHRPVLAPLVIAPPAEWMVTPVRIRPPATISLNDHTNQTVITAFYIASRQLGRGNWGLMTKARVDLGDLTRDRDGFYKGPDFNQLHRLTEGEKEKIRNNLLAKE